MCYRHKQLNKTLILTIYPTQKLHAKQINARNIGKTNSGSIIYDSQDDMLPFSKKLAVAMI